MKEQKKDDIIFGVEKFKIYNIKTRIFFFIICIVELMKVYYQAQGVWHSLN